jgi:hypothetical protein
MSSENEILIEKYIKGELNSSELEAFETNLKTNAELVKELDFQQNLVEGIKVARANALKARLNTLEIPANNNSFYKIAAIIAIILGLGFWLWDANFNKTEENLIVNVGSNTSNTIVEKETIVNTDIKEEVIVSEVETKTETVVENKSVEKEKSVVNASGDVPILPNNMEFSDDLADKSLKSEDNDLLKRVDVDRKTLNINVVTTSAYNFHYQYSEKQLLLYGNFENVKYQIIQYNSQQKTLLYLYLNNAFYEINTDKNSIQSLVEVTDKTKLAELKNRL